MSPPSREVTDRVTVLSKPRRRGKSSATTDARQVHAAGHPVVVIDSESASTAPAAIRRILGRPPRGRRMLARRRRSPPRAAPPRQFHPDCLARRHWQHAGYGPFAGCGRPVAVAVLMRVRHSGELSGGSAWKNRSFRSKAGSGTRDGGDGIVVPPQYGQPGRNVRTRGRSPRDGRAVVPGIVARRYSSSPAKRRSHRPGHRARSPGPPSSWPALTSRP